MADLEEILSSGEIEKIDITGTDVKPLIELILSSLADGITVPELPSAQAGINCIFVNTDGTQDRLCFKNADGTVLRFRMQAI